MELSMNILAITRGKISPTTTHNMQDNGENWLHLRQTLDRIYMTSISICAMLSKRWLIVKIIVFACNKAD